jgi:hypothetical protein
MTSRRNIGIGTGLVLALLLVGAHTTSAPAAKDRNEHDRNDRDGRTIRITSNAASTFFTASFSFTSPNEPANYAIFAGEGTFGKFSGQGVSQSAPSGNSCTLPDGSSGIELVLVGHLAASRFERTGDLLFERGDPGDLKACLNLQTMRFHEEGTVKITGGTGKFEGASGVEHVSVDGGLLQAPQGLSPVVVGLPNTPASFGFASGKFIMEFTVPRR